ncbi:phage tail tape measure protein [Paracoccus sp. MKU1]|uniref:phage tail tape measure protein n=1 Tax=Paracoccus sp. MKU1 TaxID=1745182 RepID=UPI000A8AB873|nr:phage tail tape measure protein [Paracoccus sp. MKU1]
MATNRDITFVLKMKNAARAAMKRLGMDWRDVATRTKEAQKAARDAEKQTDRVRKSSEGLKRAQSVVKQLQDRFAGLRKEVLSADGAMKKIHGSAAKAAVGVAAGISAGAVAKATVASYAGFADQMATVKAVTSATATEMHDMTEAAIRMGSTTRFTATQAGGGLEELTRAGFDAYQAIDALPAVLNLATADNLDLARSSEIVAVTLQQFGLGAKDADHVADALAQTSASTSAGILDLAEAMNYAGTIASQLGVDVDEALGALGALSNVGLKGSIAGTAVRAALLDSTMIALGQSTKKAQTAFDALKIDPNKFNPEKVGIVGMIKALVDANAQTDDLTALFGERGVSPVSALMDAYRDGSLEKLIAENATAMGRAAQMASDRANSLAGDWKALVSAVQTLGIRIGQALDQPMRAIVQFATAFVQALQGMTPTTARFAEAAETAVQVIKTLGMAIGVVAGSRVLLGFLSLARAGFTGVTTAAAAMQTGVGKISSVFSVLSRFSILIRGVGAALRAVPYVGWAMLAVDAIRRVMAITFNWKGTTISVMDVMKTLWSRFSTWVTGAVERVKTAINGLKDLWGEFVSWFQSSGIQEGGTTFLTRLVDEVTEARDNVNDVLNGIIGAFAALPAALDVATSNIPATLEAVFVMAMNSVIDTVQAGINSVLTSIRTFLSSIDGFTAGTWAETDFASKIGSIDLSKYRLEASHEAQEVGDRLKEAFAGAMDVDYIGGLAAKAAEVANDAVGSILDETAARREKELWRLEHDKGGITGRVDKPVKKAVDPDGPDRPGDDDAGGGGSKKSGGSGKEEKDPRAEFRKKIADETKSIQLQIAAAKEATSIMREYGLTKDQATKVAEIVAEAEALGLAKSEVDALRDSFADLAQQQAAAALIGTDFVTQFTSQFADFRQQVVDATQLASGVVQSLGDVTSNFLDNIFEEQMSVMDALKSAVGDTFKEIGKMIMDYALKVMVFKYLLGGLGFGVSNTGAVTMPSAKGNAFTEAGEAVKFAKGSPFANKVVTQPTLFTYSDGGKQRLGEMGEAGDEAIMPLARDGSGRLGVRTVGSRSEQSTTQGDTHIHVSTSVTIPGGAGSGGSTSPDAQKALAKSLSNEIKTTVIEVVHKEMRPGGALYGKR